MPSKRLCKIFDISIVKSYLYMFTTVGIVILITSCASFEHLTMITEDTFPQAIECGKCHVEIYKEWLQSDHAIAYKNPHFREATDDYSFEECLSCHAPLPTVSNTAPVTRSVNRDEGVTCVSCHLKEGKLSGPIEPRGSVSPHPVDVNPDFYRDSDICGRCHKREFNEWKSVNTVDKKTCQQCHMPSVTRKVTQSTGGISEFIVALEHEVQQKRHSFPTVPSQLDGDIISIDAINNGSSVTLTIRNNLLHSLPTGDFGFRFVVMEVDSLDSKGNTRVLAKKELVKELKTAIAPMAATEWQLSVPLDTIEIRFKLRRFGPEQDDIVNLVDIEVPLQ